MFYVLYEINTTSGTFGHTTSNWAEVNHASVIRRLTKNFCNDLDMLLLAVLDSQKKLFLTTYQDIVNNCTTIRIKYQNYKTKH